MQSLFTSAAAVPAMSSPSFSRPAASPRSVFDLGGAGASFGTAVPIAASAPTTSTALGRDRVRVLVVDSDADCLRRFASAVGADTQLQLLATAGDTETAMANLSRYRPEVLIVEPGMAQNFGLALIRHCAARLPQTDILVRTQVGDDERVLAAIEAGAAGYVYRDAAPEWVVASIHALRDGGALISPGVARRVLARFRLRSVVTSGFGALGGGGGGAAEPDAAVLSEEEIAILRLAACGTGLPEISEVLALSPRKVLSHVKGIYRQLAASRGRPC